MDGSSQTSSHLNEAPQGAPIVVASAYFAGLAAMAVAHFLAAQALDPFTWIPLGPVAMGLIAAALHGIFLWVRGERVGRLSILVGVAVALSWVTAWYVEFRLAAPLGEDGKALGFVDYFDLLTRGLREVRNGKVGEPAGAGGYFDRLLAVASFSVCGATAAWALRNKPYCAKCGKYLRDEKKVGALAAGLPAKLLDFGRSGEKAAAKAKGLAEVTEILAAADGEGERVLPLLRERASGGKEVDALSGRVHFKVSACPTCGEGELTAVLLEGHGRGQSTKVVGRRPLSQAAVQLLK